MQIEFYILIIAILILISTLLAKALDNVGVPTLLLFIGVGMLAGSEGPGGIYFDNTALTQSIGIVALMFILFAGGLDTDWKSAKNILGPAFSLATVGVIITAGIIGVIIHLVFNVDLLLGILIGSIISSTDAAAVFSILRSKNVSLKGDMKPLLELESGSNDPMAVFLTIGTIQLINHPATNIWEIVLMFFSQMGIGAVTGFLLGKVMIFSINKLRFSYEGVYPVFALSVCMITFSLTNVIGGSGFLAIYVAGIIIGNGEFIHKKSLIRFFDGLSVLSQIMMFLTLGLLVFPSKLLNIIGIGFLIAFALMLVARPISVFITLIPFKFNLKEKLFISWVGLRGAVPIILGTFPLIAGIPDADLIFNVVFFIVITSVLLQGWTLNPATKLLGLYEPFKRQAKVPLEFDSAQSSNTELLDFIVPFNSKVAGTEIVNLKFPPDSRIILIWRNENSIIPYGGSVLEEGDIVLVLVNKKNIEEVKKIFS